MTAPTGVRGKMRSSARAGGASSGDPAADDTLAALTGGQPPRVRAGSALDQGRACWRRLGPPPHAQFQALPYRSPANRLRHGNTDAGGPYGCDTVVSLSGLRTASMATTRSASNARVSD